MSVRYRLLTDEQSAKIRLFITGPMFRPGGGRPRVDDIWCLRESRRFLDAGIRSGTS